MAACCKVLRTSQSGHQGTCTFFAHELVQATHSARLVRAQRRARQYLAHVVRDHFAKILHVVRNGTPLVPENRTRFTKRFTLVRDRQSFQSVAIESHERRDDRHAMPGLRKREQGVRRAALVHNIRLEAGEMACRVESFAEREGGVHCQQWICRKMGEFDRVAGSKLKRSVTGGPKFQRRDWIAAKVVASGGHHLVQVYSEIGFAALDEGKNLKANGLNRSNLYIRIAFGIS